MVMVMAFDYKKEYKEFYLPPKKPGMIEVPRMNYIAVRGHGDPNEEEGEYKAAIGLLYAIAFTVKMSYRAAIRWKAIFLCGSAAGGAVVAERAGRHGWQ